MAGRSNHNESAKHGHGPEVRSQLNLVSFLRQIAGLFVVECFRFRLLGEELTQFLLVDDSLNDRHVGDDIRIE